MSTTVSLNSLGDILSQSFPNASTRAKAIAKILAGREIGIGPVSAMAHIGIDKGKITYDAALLSWLIEQSPIYDYRIIRHDEQRCEIEFYREGELRGKTCWTIEHARKAGLVKDKSGWISYADDYLFARALTQGIRRHCPGLLIGAYAPEEMGVETETAAAPVEMPATGAVVAVTQAPPILKATTEQLLKLKEARKILGVTDDQWKAILAKRSVTTAKDFTPEQCSDLYNAMAKKIQLAQLAEGLKERGRPLAEAEAKAEATAEPPVAKSGAGSASAVTNGTA